jgi:hypothetical protein
MNYLLNLRKMETEEPGKVRYFLGGSGARIPMNDLIGQKLSITFRDQINCISCGSVTKTSFAQGYCYACFISSPETEDCVLRPELCQAHQGIARDIEFAKGHCLIDHYVYMAVSGGLKVGVTRHTQKPVRWIDQGASQAIIIAVTPNRYLAGCIEVALKKHIPDKTNWRKMLSSEYTGDIDLVKEKNKALESLHEDFRQYAFSDNEITRINYPVKEYPSRIKSLSLDKVPQITDILTGIKGQYLIFSSGEVLNVRKHGGYLVEISAD